MITKQVRFYLNTDNTFTKIFAKQGDSKSRYVEGTLYNDNIPYTPQEGSTAIVKFLKPDKTKTIHSTLDIDPSVSLVGNKINFELTEAMLAVAGDGIGDISIIENGGVLSTAIFKVVISASAVPDSAVVSTDEYKTLEDALIIVGSIANKLDKDGDGKDLVTTITDSTVEEDFTTLEKDGVKWGKVKKSISTFRTWLGNLTSNFAPIYDPSITYVLGKYRTYNNLVYKCTTAITTPESWNVAKWTVVNLGDEVSTINTSLSNRGTTVALVSLTGLTAGGTTVTIPNISTYKYLYIEIVDNAGTYHEGKTTPVSILQRYVIETISMEYSATYKADAYFKFTSNTSITAYLSLVTGWASINMNVYGIR